MYSPLRGDPEVMDELGAAIGTALTDLDERRGRPPRRAGGTPGMAVDAGDWLLRGGVALAGALSRYHRHRVRHLDRLAGLFERGCRVVLVGNHALDIVDPLLLLAEVYRQTGRLPRFVGHENGWFRLPWVREFSRHFQVIPSRRPEETVAAVERDGFLMLYPGGVRESGLRRYRDEPYILKWQDRMGFLRVALETGAEVVFVAAVGSEEAYYQTTLPTPRVWLRALNAGDDLRYRNLGLRFGAAGAQLLPGVLPLPVRITHALSEPLDLGDRQRARSDPKALIELHTRLWDECQRFLDGAVALRRQDSDLLDLLIRSGQRVLQRIGI